MAEPARPVLVVSRCLGFEACRYNGQVIPDRFVDVLARHAEVITVCPEVAIGLGTPRAPIRVEEDGSGRRLVQPSTGLDLTDRMTAFAAEFLDDLPEVDGFVLKARSPSCGITDSKIHSPKGMTLGRGPGLFAEAVLSRWPRAAVEDEGRLTNLRIREHFLTRVFTTAAFRRTEAKRSVGALVRFHAERKLLLMGLNQTAMRELGRIVATAKERGIDDALAAYREGLDRAFARLPSRVSWINVLMHALGYFKRGLGAAEKAHFLDTLEDYRAGRTPISVPRALLGSWIARFGEDYLATQSWFSPYPAELVDLADSGRGRGDGA